ncbi:MAG: DUF502 domain-containing protein [Alphaproteobacteria bacterium]|nr:DUF502 domain-containing protein [Alphaproteobacteria bacterium]
MMDINPPPADSDIITGSRGVGPRLRRYFLTGILVTAPIFLTVYLTYVFFTFIDTQVSRILPHELYSALYGGPTVPGLGIIIALAFFTVVGWFATNFMGRMIIRMSEYVVHRVPIINTIYKGLKQVFETVLGSQAQAFREAVMFEFPRKGIWVIGFVTGLSKGEVQRLTEDVTMNVFFPTTPNPTSGFLLLIPKKDLIPLGMSVDDAIKMIISGGILTSPDIAVEGETPPQQVVSHADKSGDA